MRITKRHLPVVFFIACIVVNSVAQTELTAIQIARKALPSVVLIVCDNEDDEGISLGSGFFIEPGVVVTNYHVIEGNSRGIVQVALGERKEKKIFRIARILSYDEDADLALLSVPSAINIKIPNLSLSQQSYKPEVGETVFALGNPEGLVGTMTQGLVSAEVRSSLKRARIQISAPISQGSSGGPVLNQLGHVIGVAVGSRSEGQNLNFAVPSTLLYNLFLSTEFPTEMRNQLDRNADNDNSRPRPWENPLEIGVGTRRTLKMFANGEAGQPKNSGEYFERGTRYVKEKRYKDAIDDFSMAIRLDPKSVGAFLNRGLVYGLMGNVALEIADYNRAIQINPRIAHAYFNRGTAYGKQNKTDLELLDYSKAIELNPNMLLAYYYRAEIYSKQGKKHLALQDLNDVIRIDPKYINAYIRRGNLHKDANRLNLAIADYTSAIKIDSGSSIAYYNRGVTHMLMKEYDLAIDDLSNAILLDPKNASAFASRSYCYCMTGQTALSLRDFNRAMELGAVAALQCNK